MADRRPERLRALAEALEQAHLDGLLLTGLANVRYLTGFTGSSALAFVTARGEALLVTDFRYQTQAADEVGDLARTLVEAQSLWSGLWSALPQLPHVKVVGFESPHLLHRDFARLLEQGERWQWRPAIDVVEALRERKAPEEVEHVRAANTIAVGALDRTLRDVRAGLTELQVAGMLEHALRDAGSESFPFETIVASGPRSALPHARASARVIEAGDLLLIDFGAQHGGYCADVTRTVVVGRASDEQRALHDIVRGANAVAVAGVRAGQRGRDADALARGFIAHHGWGEAFGHSLGHGLGLEVHEAPRLSRAADSVLPVGAVVTIEPGIYRPGWGGVRIEDDVHLGADGTVLLTHYPRELLEVGG